ncbi:MAG: MoxR family ATPase [Deltaproteobacteria bacterium]|nr:MoxR family ATPase [Deltaproteobacteria bacterium]
MAAEEQAPSIESRVEAFKETCLSIREEVGRVIVGHEEVVEGVITALLAGGHVLLEGVPGIGKTLLVRTFSDALDLSFSRIQFTPDLMPADVTGTMLLVDKEGGGRKFEFNKGPIFASFVLADEINRATPKTQSSLLEAMQEHRVTTMGSTYSIDPPFVVLATQNPIEMEGTYTLPEAQLDRFLVKIMLRFPSDAELREILDRTTIGDQPQARKIADRARLLEMIETVRDMQIENRSVVDYVVRVIQATHPDADSASEPVKKYVRYGASPRGAQSLILGAKVRALMDGRVSVDFDDVRHMVLPALRHRIILNFEGESAGQSTDDILSSVLDHVPDVKK